MPAPLILCERTPRWAGAFRRELRKAPREVEFRIAEVRSFTQCERELAASPHSVAAIEMTSQNLHPALQALVEYRDRFPHVRLIALADRELAPHELLVREAGAIQIVFSPRSLASSVRLIRRHLARAPKKETTLEEAVWNKLPWAGATQA